MVTKRELKEEITRLNYRISELEERLCPCEEHDWKEIGYYFTSYAYYPTGLDFDTVYKYKCKRCGKLREE